MIKYSSRSLSAAYATTKRFEGLRLSHRVISHRVIKKHFAYAALGAAESVLSYRSRVAETWRGQHLGMLILVPFGHPRADSWHTPKFGLVRDDGRWDRAATGCQNGSTWQRSPAHQSGIRTLLCNAPLRCVTIAGFLVVRCHRQRGHHVQNRRRHVPHLYPSAEPVLTVSRG
jgi:hypothetical protein